MREWRGHTAKDVSEMILAFTGEALMKDDFEGFARCFHLPHRIETPDHKRILRTRAELKTTFDRVVADYRRKRVTDLVRICEVAEFKSDTRIEATHSTHLMSGQHRVAAPFPNFTVLQLIDGRWQSTSTQYGVDRDTMVGWALEQSARDEASGT